MRKNVKNPLQALNEEVLGATFTLLRTVPVRPGDYSIIGKVKSRDVKKFSKEEAVEFEKKFSEVRKLEKIERTVGFIFSRSGFTKETQDYCREQGIACSEDERWLESGKLKTSVG